MKVLQFRPIALPVARAQEGTWRKSTLDNSRMQSPCSRNVLGKGGDRHRLKERGMEMRAEVTGQKVQGLVRIVCFSKVVTYCKRVLWLLC